MGGDELFFYESSTIAIQNRRQFTMQWEREFNGINMRISSGIEETGMINFEIPQSRWHLFG